MGPDYGYDRSRDFCAARRRRLLKRSGRGRIIRFVVARRLAGLAGVYALLRFEGGIDHADEMSGAGAGAGDYGDGIAPGTIQFEGEAPDADFIQRVPLQRTGTADDIAEAALYFATAPFVTGQFLAVDGGRMLV